MEQRLTFFTRVRVDVYGEAAWTVKGLATRIADVAPVVPVLQAVLLEHEGTQVVRGERHGGRHRTSVVVVGGRRHGAREHRRARGTDGVW